MLSINEGAYPLVQKLMAQPERLNITVTVLKNGATVIDCGQKVPGSFLAGKYYAEITAGGMTEVDFETAQVGPYTLPAARVTCSQPLLAGWVSQRHADPIPGQENQPILAGPAKTFLPGEESVQYAGYVESFGYAIAPLQTEEPITEDYANWVAKACNISPRKLYILPAPSRSLVCAIQVAARPVDQTMHRVQEEGFDIRKVLHVYGGAAIPPLAPDEATAMGRINDCLLYGTNAILYMEGEDDALEHLASQMTIHASPEYGKPFKQIFEEAGNSFHNIDIRTHSVARVQINNVLTGRTFCAGKIETELLLKSYFGES
ncbi:MAG: methenyltetrahydromethanopterin cyclohydrolase [Anaerolineae bacterium]|jgi:methenyltetrahydromethanopterin cyclohydrolase|nr:methenyltetrahydromethanopterin cyclohydrolase [Anaerolineae bacterium]